MGNDHSGKVKVKITARAGVGANEVELFNCIKLSNSCRAAAGSITGPKNLPVSFYLSLVSCLKLLLATN